MAFIPNILDKIIVNRMGQVELLKASKKISDFEKMIENKSFKKREFTKALKSSTMSIIAEVKKASPSKGVFLMDFPYIDIAREYENAGANAISVLTEESFFQGSNVYLKEIRNAVKLPILRKDFIVDEIQLYESKAIGADAVLLISSVLKKEKLKEYIKICDSLKLDYIVEVHNEEEVFDAITALPKVIGINNRDLKTFEVSLETTKKLRGLIPEDTVIISESGIHTFEDIILAESYGADAVLIGEAFIKSNNIAEKFKEFRGEV